MNWETRDLSSDYGSATDWFCDQVLTSPDRLLWEGLKRSGAQITKEFNIGTSSSFTTYWLGFHGNLAWGWEREEEDQRSRTLISKGVWSLKETVLVKRWRDISETEGGRGVTIFPADQDCWGFHATLRLFIWLFYITLRTTCHWQFWGQTSRSPCKTQAMLSPFLRATKSELTSPPGHRDPFGHNRLLSCANKCEKNVA